MEAVSNISPTRTRCGWLFYDGDCPLCRGAAARAESMLRRRGFLLLPLQTQGVTERLGLPLEELLREVKLLAADGRIYGGADAMLEIGRKFWWAWPVLAFAQWPGGLRVLRWLYARVAANRYCLSNACSVARRKAKTRQPRPGGIGRRPVVSMTGWLPVLLLPSLVFVAQPFLPALRRWLRHLACCVGLQRATTLRASTTKRPRRKRVFFEMP